MAGVVTAVCYSLNNIIIYWTFYKKMLSISAGPYLSVSITQRWGVENLPLSSHALASFRGSLGFQCTTTLLAQQKKIPIWGGCTTKKIPIWGGLYSPLNFVAQFLSALSLCGIVIYIIVVVVVMVFLGWPLMNLFPCSKYTVGMLSMYAI